MTGQNAYLVTYDISSPGRLKRVHRLISGYGDPLQYSVFRCKLNRRLHQCLLTDLHELLDLREDRVMIVDLGPVPGRGKEAIVFLGRDSAPPERGPMIF
jgi:CRISPR-associated protein Cas2